VKAAQVAGLDDYPVFTRKVATDVSYIACARRLLAARDVIYPAFATHNANTIGVIKALAGEGDFEFQRLHGMGEGLYEELARLEAGIGEGQTPVRIYAPVGSHKELLAYLVRRLLENGANSSFVNRIRETRRNCDGHCDAEPERHRGNTPDIGPAPRSGRGHPQHALRRKLRYEGAEGRSEGVSTERLGRSGPYTRRAHRAGREGVFQPGSEQDVA
jgi:hypothetical protein